MKTGSSKKTETIAPNPAVMGAQIVRIDSLLPGFMGYLPNPDEILTEAGEALEIYREMKLDPRVKSLLAVLKSAVKNFPGRLDKGAASEAAEKLITDAFGSDKRFALEKRLLRAIDFGYSVVEVVWENRDGYTVPKSFVALKPERFAFTLDGNLLVKKLGAVEPLNDPYKFLVYRHDEDAENPYGTSVLKSCYWPWKFKKAGLEFWLMAAEKFAVPSILAIFEQQGGEDAIRERALGLSEMLAQVRSGSGAALANIKDTKVIESSDALSEFKSLMDWCDTQIAYGIVFQSLTTQEAQNGTRAQAEVHEGTFTSTAKDTCRDLAEVEQLLIDWIIALNIGDGEPSPRLVYDLEDYASWDAVKAAIEAFVPVSLSALYTRYGIPKPASEADTFIKPETVTSGTGTIPTPEGTGGEGQITSTTDVQSTAMNGAQVSSLIEVASQVAEGILPLDTAKAIAKAAFPLVKDEDINAIFLPLSGFEAKTLADEVKKNDRLRIVGRPR